jgi:hypothetical protein
MDKFSSLPTSSSSSDIFSQALGTASADKNKNKSKDKEKEKDLRNAYKKIQLDGFCIYHDWKCLNYDNNKSSIVSKEKSKKTEDENAFFKQAMCSYIYQKSFAFLSSGNVASTSTSVFTGSSSLSKLSSTNENTDYSENLQGGDYILDPSSLNVNVRLSIFESPDGLDFFLMIMVIILFFSIQYRSLFFFIIC